VLAQFGIGASYVLSDAQLAQDVGAVALSGRGTFALPGAPPLFRSNVAARLVATSPSDLDQFELALAIADPGWTFDRTFPVLPPSQQLETQFAPYTDSVLATMRVDAATFTARSAPGATLRLSGRMPVPAGPAALVQHVDLLAPWPLRLDGTITIPANAFEPPAFDLIAVSSARLQLGPVGVEEVGLQLLAVTGLDEELQGLTAYSIVNLTGVFYIGQARPLRARISTPILLVSDSWHFLAEFEEDANSIIGLASIEALFGVPVGRYVPASFVELAGFYLSDLEVVVGPIRAGAGAPEFKQIAVTLTSRKTWTPPIPFVRLTDVAARWVVGWTPVNGEQAHYISGAVAGTLLIGSPAGAVNAGASPSGDADPTSVAIGINALLPSFVMTGQLQDDSWIPLGTGFRAFFGDPGPATGRPLAITSLSVVADPRAQTYAADGAITLAPIDRDVELTPVPEAIWTIPLGANVALHLTELSFQIGVTQGAVTGGVYGEIVLEGGAPPGDPDPRIVVSAEYTGSESRDGWVFGGELYRASFLELKSLVSNFLGISPPQSLPSLTIEQLAVRFATRSKAFALSGTVSSRWCPQLFGSPRLFSATASVDVQKAGQDPDQPDQPDPPIVGRLQGRFSIEKLAVTVGIDIGVDKPTYLFVVEFGGVALTAVTGWHGEDPQHQVLSLQLSGVTLGGMLEYLVNLAAPTLGFRLEPPWDVLNRIDLSRFVLTIDPTDNTVELVYTVNADLVLMYLEQVCVRYTRQDGEGAVELILTGRMLARTYTWGKPLAWNVVKDPPPAIPGEGYGLIDLRYLGAGQHVTLKGEMPITVAETIARLRAAMQEPQDTTANPLEQPSGAGMRFAPESEWLIGLDVGLLEAIDLAFVFNDPRLYGLSVALDGEKMGPLAGLRFEILYKKISDTVGMFRVELRLPEAFRHIEMGEVSITLGVIAVEVYTNGSFLIDFGFPYDRDYDRSFTVQVFPFIGRGGIYFGLLDGTTSRRVPAITNGTFAPVLELGIGLAVGVGKEIRVGPVSGGVYVEIEVIFQGVLGWFNPSSSGVASAKYYWGQGIAAIHGKLYGEADFAVVKAMITIEAYAQASVVFEAYQPTIFRLAVGVSVEAQVEVLFVDLSFTFQAELDVSFTVGRARPTPWLLAAGQGASTQARLRSNHLAPLRRDPVRRAARLRTEHLASLHRAGRLAALPPAPSLEGSESPYVLNWNPQLAVFSNAPRPVPLTMLPAFSLTQVPVSWTGAAPTNTDPQYRVAFLLFAPNGITPRAASVRETLARSAALSAHASDTDELSADVLIEAFLRWSISAVTGSAGGNGATVTAGQVALLVEQIARAETASEGFTSSNLAKFFATNMTLQIAGDPGGSPATQGGMAVPMPPVLQWTSPQAQGLDFANYNRIGPIYQHGVDQYRAQFFPLDGPAGILSVDVPGDYESFATCMFRDWCLMLARAGAQAAQDALSGWPCSATALTSLATVAASVPNVAIAYAVRGGDTVDSVAAVLGATPAELLYLNPDLASTLAAAAAGETISVTLGVSPEAVAIDNADVALAASVTLALGSIDYQAGAADTLQSIATNFGLANAADLFSGTTLADDPQVLRAGATFQVPATTYTPPSGFTPLLTAAVFYVRWFGRVNIPWADWYAQTIFDFNADALRSVEYDQPIPPGITLSVPASVNDPNPQHATTYVTVPGDTLTRIGAALSLDQNFATTNEPDADWPTFRDAVHLIDGGIALPATSIAILPGETVNLLALRTIIQAGNQPGMIGWLASAPVLSPLALIGVPAVQVTTGTADTLASIATHYGLAVDDLGRRVESQGIFPGTQTAPVALTIRHLPVQDIDALVAAVLAGPAPARISGMSSRLMLSGLQLPGLVTDAEQRVRATGPLTALYELTGQQFTGPVPNPAQPSAVALTVTFSVDAGVSWVQLMGSTTVGPDETIDTLGARVPRALELNRALDQPGRLRPGLVVHSDTAGSLVFSYTNSQLAADYPATSLSISPTNGPAPMALAGRTPRTYGLDHRIELQAPAALPIPTTGSAPLTGNPSLWPFPDALLVRARAAATTPFEIVRASNRVDMGTQPDTVLNATFATRISFGLRRLEAVDHVYELRGVEVADRATLLALWAYLVDAHTPPGTAAWLMVAPAPNAGNASGVGILPTDPGRTFLVKTNLSTETAPPTPRAIAAARRVDDAGQYAAGFGDLAQFLLLLWEGSVVGGSGFYLGFATLDGDDLPASAFDQDGNVTLSLLAIAGAQQAAAPHGRPLLPFNTCAIVGPGLDASAHALFVEAADNSDLVTQALLPPGGVGFTLTVRKPVQPPEHSAEIQLRQLFSLLTYQITAVDGSPFQNSQPGLPPGPQTEDGLGLPLCERQRQARWRRAGRAVPDAPPVFEYWRYDQAIPIARFGPLSAAPQVGGLPDPGLDPYRGIGGQTTLPSAQVQLGFADILGNVTAPPSSGEALPPGALTLQVGYTDPLVGPGGWPAVTTSYALAKADNVVTLAITVASQAGLLMPAPDQSPNVALDAAGRQAARFATAYYQLAQPGVAASVLTSLQQNPDGTPAPIATAVAPLWGFTAAGYVAAQAAAALLPVQPTASAALTLQQIVQTFGVTCAEIAQANATSRVFDLFGAATVMVPAFQIFAAGDTADSLAAALPPGWPTLSGTQLLELPANADVLPLRPGIELTIPSQNFIVDLTPPVPPLAEIALAHNTLPALLAGDNATTTGILTQGFVFEMDGVTVTVGETVEAVYVATFQDVAAAFATRGVNALVGDIAAGNATRGGMLELGATLATLHYVAKADDTLASNHSGASTSDLAANNHATADLFDAGALVSLGRFPNSPVITSDNPETLVEFADRFGCPPEQILAANPTLAVPTGSALVLPGTVAMPTGGTGIYVPYTLLAGDTLDGIVAKFAPAPGSGSAAVNLANANLTMPGTIASGQTVRVTIGGTTWQTPTQAGDSFQSVLGRLQAESSTIQLSNLVQAIEGSAGYLATGGLLVCPPARLPAPAQGVTSIAPDAIFALYGVDATAFAQANAALLGVIAAGVTLHTADNAVSVTTGDRDTFNSIVSRFAQAGAQVGIPEVVTANHDTALLAVGALALLPPAPVSVPVSLGASAGPFATPAFPLTVALRIERPARLIDPSIATTNHDGPAERADSIVPAPLQQQGGAAQTLDAFSTALRTALPSLRLAAGRVDGTAADLWVVNFGAGGITQVTVAPGVTAPHGELWPRFFALRPLYNELVTRDGVLIRTLLPDGTLSPEQTPTTYQSVDVEVWARRFLADVDLFLTAPYATGAYRSAGARTALEQVSDAKASLSQAIPRGLAAVLDLADPRREAGLAEAIRRLGQEVKVSLAKAYDTSAIVQYDATVSSAWAENSQLLPARLFGSAQPALPQSRPSDDPAPLPYSLTTAKTALDQTSSFVTFLMRVADPARHRAVPVDLDYDLSYLEMNIRQVPGVSGYEASDWLAFVPPLADGVAPADVRTDLGATTVPIPLRAFPALPTLLGQTARATAGDLPDPTLGQTVQWTYGVTYSHEHAEQDEVSITTTYNIPPGVLRAGDGPDDVARALAKYIAVADDLWALLAGFAAPAGADPIILDNAAATFAGLVANVATAWDARWPSAASLAARAALAAAEPDARGALAAPSLVAFRFGVRLTYFTGDDNVVYLGTLTLTSEQANPGPTGRWPDAFCDAPDGTRVALTPEQPVGQVLIYQFPTDTPIPAVDWPRITLEWPGLSVDALQNGRASLSVRRNRKLLGDDGPDTADDFVYRTPVVEAAEVVTPLNTWPERIDITNLGATVELALSAAFAALFGSATGQPITVGVSYGFELVPPQDGSDGLVTYLPVGLYPNQQLGSGTAAAIADALTAWQTANQPATRGGEWVISLALYSQLDAAARRPLLMLDRLVYRLTAARVSMPNAAPRRGGVYVDVTPPPRALERSLA
jgi:LysM repeat protein